MNVRLPHVAMLDSRRGWPWRGLVEGSRMPWRGLLEGRRRLPLPKLVGIVPLSIHLSVLVISSFKVQILSGVSYMIHARTFQLLLSAEKEKRKEKKEGFFFVNTISKSCRNSENLPNEIQRKKKIYAKLDTTKMLRSRIRRKSI